MAIDRSVVEKAAGLARIALTPEEVERFTGQLSVVLQAVE
ncbi:MAG TPA: Asp-tRNA(Asn)/Glu-tRNA(Gln) amidotransferase subunit GatC, partial [Candidatus Limnocylindria bacterium]